MSNLVLEEHSSDPEDVDPVPNPVTKPEAAHHSKAFQVLDMAEMQ